MKCLLTGGAGFIGSRLIQILISKGYECLVADNLSVGLPIPVKPPFVFEKLDIRDREGLTAAMVSFRPEAVVHGLVCLDRRDIKS